MNPIILSGDDGKGTPVHPTTTQSPTGNMREHIESRSISEQIVQYILTISHDDFSSLTVSKLSYRFEIERCKLSRSFKDETGMTLEDFIRREKMFRAAFMLVANRDISVKEVSRKIGYCTCDYFIRVFREFYGIGPGRFKELKTNRNIGDRRNNGKDRRKKTVKSKIPKNGDHRSGLKDRRNGGGERRKQKSAQADSVHYANGNTIRYQDNNFNSTNFRQDQTCAHCQHKKGGENNKD